MFGPCTIIHFLRTALTDVSFSPAATREKPFHLISSDPTDVAQLAEAEQNPHTFLINDWRHYTSDELLAIWKASNIEPLYVALMSPYYLRTIDVLALI